MKLTKPTPNTEIQNGMIRIPDVEVIIKTDAGDAATLNNRMAEATAPEMKLYHVTRKEVHHQDIEVMASSPGDAVDRAIGGEGNDIGLLQYSYTMDSSDCDVYEQDEEGDWELTQDW